MRLVKYVIVVAAGMLLLSSCASMRKGSSRFDSSESIYVKEEPRKVEVKQTAPEPKPEPAIVVREERVTPIGQTGPKGKYYIIIGSFQVLDNARRFSNDLTNEGFSPILLKANMDFSVFLLLHLTMNWMHVQDLHRSVANILSIMTFGC